LTCILTLTATSTCVLVYSQSNVSRDLFKFGEMTNNISETVSETDIPVVATDIKIKK